MFGGGGDIECLSAYFLYDIDLVVVMVSKPIEVLWFLPHSSMRYSGVVKYSTTFIEELRKNDDIRIMPVWIDVWKPLYFLYVRLVFPIIYARQLMDKRIIKIFPDESFAYIYLLPIRSSCIIIHHLVDSLRYDSLSERIYFCIIKLCIPLVGRAKRVICVSKGTCQQLRRKFPKMETVVIPNAVQGVQGIKYESTIRQVTKSQKIKVLYVGTDEKRKNVHVLLRAFSKHPFELTWIGKKQCADRIPASVRVYEDVSDEFLAKSYLNADFVVSASSFEGFGRPLIETQLYGGIFVGSNIAAFREVGCKGAVLFDKYLSHIHWRTLLLELYTDHQRLAKIRSEARNNVKKYTVKVVSRKFANLIKDIVNQ